MLDARNVTAIVVTYNRLPLLKQCLAALRAQTVQGFTVLLVDNASTDGTADYSKDAGNAGAGLPQSGGKPRRCGRLWPTASAPRWSWGVRPSGSMDDDTLPEPDALAALLAADAAHGRRLRLAVQQGTRPGRHRPADEPAEENDVPRY